MDVSEGSYELKAKERSGSWVRVEGILSGGERSAAAICIRIAFSLVLARNLSWLILDEPTHNLDHKAVETLGSMMQRHLPSIVEQVFVITHDAEMKKAASASLYLLEREKDEDAVTRPVLVQAEC
jgi:DNA repair exonuclease SbcCD ATPase subunit